MEDRLKLLQEAHRDFGPSSQHFLSSEYILTLIYNLVQFKNLAGAFKPKRLTIRKVIHHHNTTILIVIIQHHHTTNAEKKRLS